MVMKSKIVNQIFGICQHNFIQFCLRREDCYEKMLEAVERVGDLCKKMMHRNSTSFRSFKAALLCLNHYSTGPKDKDYSTIQGEISTIHHRSQKHDKLSGSCE